jgi:hypothetical protein
MGDLVFIELRTTKLVWNSIKLANRSEKAIFYMINFNIYYDLIYLKIKKVTL